MSKKVRVLLKKLILFLGLLALGHLADGLPDAIWSFIIQSGLYGSALIVGIRLLIATNQDLDDYRQHQDKN